MYFKEWKYSVVKKSANSILDDLIRNFKILYTETKLCIQILFLSKNVFQIPILILLLPLLA